MNLSEFAANEVFAELLAKRIAFGLKMNGVDIRQVKGGRVTVGLIPEVPDNIYVTFEVNYGMVPEEAKSE